MAEPLAAHRESIGSRIRAASTFCLFLDFDGTLVPIVNDPMTCRLPGDLQQTLGSLAAAPQTFVGIVSGRDLADLRPRIGIEGIAYAGNHGLEIESPVGAFREPTAERLRPDLDRVVATLAVVVAGFAGAWVQHKGLSASVHFRQVAPGAVPELREAVHRIVQPEIVAGRFVLRTGKAVWEVRPAVDWHKGRAVRWLLDRFAPDSTSTLVSCIGDDETDEDAFTSLPGQVTVCVSSNHATAAAYTATAPEEVAGLLTDMLRWRT